MLTIVILTLSVMENIDEIQQYQKLTKQQKDFVDALRALDFKWKYFSTWENLEYGTIDVSRINRLSELLKIMFNNGLDQKRFEFQRVLGI